jgi:hypothetical protein
MGVTRLKRKAKKNKIVAKQRQFNLKKLLAKPVIKKLTPEQSVTAEQSS